MSRAAGRSPAEVRGSGSCSWAVGCEKSIEVAVGCSPRSSEVVDAESTVAESTAAGEIVSNNEVWRERAKQTC